jgi:hypothetical protein
VTTAPDGGTLLSFAVAVMLTLPPGGGDAGAVYTPALLMLPQAPATVDWQFKVQFTAIALPPTVAVKVCVPPAGTVTDDGLTTMLTVGVAGEVMVTCAVPDTALSACETAATVTTAGVGTLFGAVYKPEEEMNPIPWLPPTMVLTDQVTAVLVVLATVAVNCCVAPVVTVATVGESVTVIVVVVVDFLLPPQPASVINNANTTATDTVTRFIYHS